MTDESLRKAALAYHERPRPGKIEVAPTKPLTTQRDLALAYSPGVAAACEEIADDPGKASAYTSRGNLVAVISNGTAVLGLGNIGPLASKPVMEGKGVLFKKFAGIDVFDIEVDETDPDKLVDVVAALEPTFGGVNLEDIKAPECFEVEEKLRARMQIPVFHDDQHGTAIIVAAAVTNGLRCVGKKISEAKLVTSGAGAAAIACLDLLVDMGMPVDNITVTDINGVVYEGRPVDMEPRKGRYAKDTDARTLEDVIGGADIFLGLSAPGVLKGDYVKKMADRPIIMALANPTPEILPEEARAANPDAIIATGRSDYPNQVNNVLCFPFIFRGALDVGATVINEQMKIACVKALADLAMRESSDIVASAYGDASAGFGPEYLIPKPFDPRLIVALAPAVAQAAMDSGVATRPIEDMAAYRQQLEQFVYQSGLVMRPVFERARQEPKRVAFAEGEDERVLRAVQIALDDGLCEPILIARRDVLERRIERLGLRFKPDQDVEVCDPQDDPRFNDYVASYHEIMGRRGASPDHSKTVVRTSATTIAALMVHKGEADSMICGSVGPYIANLTEVLDVIPPSNTTACPAAMSAIILPDGPLFLADTFVNVEPTAEQLVSITEMAAEEVRRFGITPKVALVSHSNFGTRATPSGLKMSEALAGIRKRCPDLEVDGEMHADAAINQAVRDRSLPGSTLVGRANLLILPNLDAANIALSLVKSLTGAVSVGPILMGASHPVHVVNTAISVRGLVNMAALATVDAQVAQQAEAEA